MAANGHFQWLAKARLNELDRLINEHFGVWAEQDKKEKWKKKSLIKFID